MTTSPIRLTDDATARVQRLVAERGNAQLKLRAHVDGCGCEGFQYLFSLDDVERDGDVTLALDGVSLVVDSESYPHLLGSQIDCLPGSQGLQFVVRDANEEVGCGC